MLLAIRAPDTPLIWAVKDPDCMLTLRPSLRLMLLVFGYFTWNPTLPTCWVKKEKKSKKERRVKQKRFISISISTFFSELSKLWKLLDIAFCVSTGSLQPLLCVCHRKERKRERKKDDAAHQRVLWKMSMAEHSCDGYKSTAALCAHLSRFQAVSSFLHFSIPATLFEFRLLIGSSLGWLECHLRSLMVELKHVTVTQLKGYRLVDSFFFSPPTNVQCFLGVLYKVQWFVHVPNKLYSCVTSNNRAKANSALLSTISKTICSERTKW